MSHVVSHVRHSPDASHAVPAAMSHAAHTSQAITIITQHHELHALPTPHGKSATPPLQQPVSEERVAASSEGVGSRAVARRRVCPRDAKEMADSSHGRVVSDVQAEE